MVTKQELNEALRVIADYERQINRTHIAAWEVGCRIKLSSWGLEMQGKRKAKLRGTVIDVIKGAVQKTTDSSICVKWDGISKPDWMHVSHAIPAPPGE
jgi:hypothetical protein